MKPEFLAQKVKFGVAKGYGALVRNHEMTLEKMLAELSFYQGHKVGSGLVSGPVSIEGLVRSDANMVANHLIQASAIRMPNALRFGLRRRQARQIT